MRAIVFLLLIFTLISECAFAELFDGFSQNVSTPPQPTRETRGEPYLDQCEQALSFFQDKRGTVEERFVDLAKTKEQMYRLLIDYQVVFSKDFAQALVFTLDQAGVPFKPTVKNLKALRALNHDSAAIKELIWKALDRMVDLKSRGEEAISQITFLQAQNLVAALKTSPNRKVFEEVMKVIVQYSLLDHIIAVAERSTALREIYTFKWDLSFATTMTVTGAILGRWLLHGAINSLTTPTSATVLGSMLGITAGVLGIIGFKPLVNKIQSSRVDALVNSAEAERTQLMAEAQSLNKDVQARLDSVFDFLEKGEYTSVLSVKEACGRAACVLSPVQIAYLGHLDLLELKTLKEAVKSTLKDVNVEKELEAVSELAHTVRKNPLDYGSQMRLRLALTKFLEKMQTILEARSKAVEALKTYVDSISQASLNALGDKTYQETPRSEEEIVGNQLLLAKMSNDMNELEQLKLDNEAISRKVERSQNVVAKLNELLGHLPKRNEGWSDAAEEVLLGLGELR